MNYSSDIEASIGGRSAVTRRP